MWLAIQDVHIDLHSKWGGVKQQYHVVQMPIGYAGVGLGLS